jgi:hypothetical protein
MILKLFERNLDAFAHLLAKHEWLRHEFLARLSCAMVQRGSHIDSLPVNEPPPPIRFPPACGERDG